MRWPDGPDGAVAWRPHGFLCSHALALRSSGAAALVRGGRLDVAQKGQRVLMRCRRSDDAEVGQARRRAHGDAVPDEDDGRRSHGSNGRREEVGPLLLVDDGGTDRRDPCADPTRALPPAEIDLPSGGAAAEAEA